MFNKIKKKKTHDVISTEQIDEKTQKLTFANGENVIIDTSEYKEKGVFTMKLPGGLELRSDWADNIPPGM